MSFCFTKRTVKKDVVLKIRAIVYNFCDCGLVVE